MRRGPKGASKFKKRNIERNYTMIPLKQRFTLTPTAGGTLGKTGSDTLYTVRGGRATFTVTGHGEAEVLLVAGGGAGGAGTGGGGGAGGLIHITNYKMLPGTYEVFVGMGGYNDTNHTGSDGDDTTLRHIETGRVLLARGGGYGASTESGSTNPYSSSSLNGYGGHEGGSGGGNTRYYTTTYAGVGKQPSDTFDGMDTYVATGFGNDGGNSTNSSYTGGGGGAGGVGTSTNGGAGKQINIDGTARYFAAGGTGRNSSTRASSIGGAHDGTSGNRGATYTGSGGGGGWSHASGNGGDGGCGIFILKFSSSSDVFWVPGKGTSSITSTTSYYRDGWRNNGSFGPSFYLDPNTAKSGSTVLDELGLNNWSGDSYITTFGGVETYYFGGSHELSRSTSGTNLYWADEFTLCMWLYPTNFSDRRNPFNLAYGGYGTITQETSGNMNYYYGDAGSNTSPYTSMGSGATYTANSWQMLTVTRAATWIVTPKTSPATSGHVRHYRNGALSNSASNSYNTLPNSTSTMYIGTGYTNQWVGYMGKIYSANYALSDEEVKYWYDITKAEYGH